jgi:ABC1 atypical kinase-like domain
MYIPKSTVASLVLLIVASEAFTIPQRSTVKPNIASQSPLFAATEERKVVDEVASALATSSFQEIIAPPEINMADLVRMIENEAEKAVQEMVDDTCEITDNGQAVDEECVNEEKKAGLRDRMKALIGKAMASLRNDDGEEFEPDMAEGEILEKGWEKRGSGSALRRNAEVWKFALSCVFKALKPRKLRKKGATETEIKEAQDEAAVFIRDGLLRLGPTFVKLGQVLSTRTDVLPKEYIDVLKSLQDEVPAFSGARAKEIISRELGKPFEVVFKEFSDEPLKAASLGQVHTAMYKGKKVAVKVQRAGLKELFDVDLKNLKKLAALLDKFDPKSDGADRNWVSIYEESERLLYLEIDYLNEANNGERFAKDFKDIDYVRVPKFYREVSTPRVLTMEFVESFKLTDFDEIEKQGLDRKVLAQKTADAFLRQIVETSYFHCGKPFQK